MQNRRSFVQVVGAALASMGFIEASVPKSESKLPDPIYSNFGANRPSLDYVPPYWIRLFSPYAGELHRQPIIMDPFDDNTGKGLRMRKGTDVLYTAPGNLQVQADIFFADRKEGTIELNEPWKHGRPSSTGRNLYMSKGDTIRLSDIEIRLGYQTTVFLTHTAKVGVVSPSMPIQLMSDWQL